MLGRVPQKKLADLGLLELEDCQQVAKPGLEVRNHAGDERRLKNDLRKTKSASEVTYLDRLEQRTT
jgi:hypothetical protein